MVNTFFIPTFAAVFSIMDTALGGFSQSDRRKTRGFGTSASDDVPKTLLIFEALCFDLVYGNLVNFKVRQDEDGNGSRCIGVG